MKIVVLFIKFSVIIILLEFDYFLEISNIYENDGCNFARIWLKSLFDKIKIEKFRNQEKFTLRIFLWEIFFRLKIQKKKVWDCNIYVYLSRLLGWLRWSQCGDCKKGYFTINRYSISLYFGFTWVAKHLKSGQTGRFDPVLFLWSNLYNIYQTKFNKWARSYTIRITCPLKKLMHLFF